MERIHQIAEESKVFRVGGFTCPSEFICIRRFHSFFLDPKMLFAWPLHTISRAHQFPNDFLEFKNP